MSSIDRRIVEMKFDNGEFKARSAETIKNLEDLEKALKIDGARKGFDDISAGAKSVDLGSISDGVDNISSKFSALGVIGVTALAKITTSAMQAGAGLIKNITEPIFGGGKRRAINLEQAEFQIRGLGFAWEDVSESINYAVDGTAYGLDVAAKAASQFLASRVPLDDMAHSLRAISGVAAMTSSSYEDIADVFTTVAGQGRVMGNDLRRLEARGLNAAASLADHFGVTEAAAREMVTKGKVSFNDFALAMDNAFGEHAKKANDTFTGAMSNVRAALARVGQQIFTPGHEALRKFFVGVIPLINGFNNALKPALGYLGGFMQEFANYAVHTFVNPFLVFADDGTVSLVDKYAYAINDTLHGLAQSLTAIVNLFIPIGKGFRNVFGGDAANGIATTAYNFAIITEKIRDFTGELSGPLTSAWTAVFSILRLAFDIIAGVIGVFTRLTGVVAGTGNSIFDFIGWLGDLISGFVDAIRASGAIQKAFETIGTVLEVPIALVMLLVDVIKALYKILEDSGIIDMVVRAIGTAFEWLGEKIQWLIDLLTPYVERLKEVEISAERVSGAVDWLRESFDKFIGVVRVPFDSVLNMIVNAFNAVSTASETGESKMQAFIRVFTNWKESVMEFFNEKFGPGTMFGDFLEGAKNFFIDLWETMKPYAEGFKDTFVNLLKEIGDVLKNLTVDDVKTALSFAMGAATVIELIKFGKAVRESMGLVKSFKESWAGMTGSIGGFFDAMSNEIKGNKLLKTAGAIAILAGALYLLAQLSVEQLVAATSAIAILALIMLGLGAAFTAMDNKMPKDGDKKMVSISFTLIAFAASILILAQAVKSLADLDEDALTRSTIAITALMVVMGAFAMAMAGWGKAFKPSKVIGSAIGIAALAGALWVVSLVLKDFANIDANTFSSGMLRLTIALGTLTVAMILLGLAGKNSLAGVLAFSVLTIALLGMYQLIYLFSLMDMETWQDSLLKIMVTLGALGVTLVVLGTYAPQAIQGALGIMALSIALGFLAAALWLYMGFEWDSFLNAMGMIAIALVALIGASMLAQTAVTGVASLVLIAVALGIMAGALWLLAQVPSEQIIPAMAALAGAVGILVAALWGLSAITPTVSVFAFAMLALALVIAAFIIGIAVLPGLLMGAALALVAFGNQISQLMEVAGALTVVGLAFVVLGVGILALAVAVGLLAIGMVLLGAGFLLLGAGLMAMAIFGPAGTAATMEMIDALLELGLIDMIKIAALAIDLGLLGAALLLLGVGAIAVAIGLALFAIAWALFAIVFGVSADPTIDAAERMAERLPPAFDLLAESLLNSSGVILPAAEEMRVAFASMVEVITEGTQSIVASLESVGKDFGTAIVSGINQALPIVQVGALLFIHMFKRAILAGTPELYSVGADLISALLMGISSQAVLLMPAGVILVNLLRISVISAAPGMSAAGSSLIEGLLTGIQRGRPQMVPAGIAVVTIFAQTVTVASLLLLRVGDTMVVVLARGIESSKSKLNLSGKQVADQFAKAVDSQRITVEEAGRRMASGLIAAVAGRIINQRFVMESAGYNVGYAVTSGMIRGINDGQLNVSAAARRVASNALSAARATLQIASPSKITTKYGRYFSEGLALGIRGGGLEVVRETKSMAETSIDALRDAFMSDRDLFDDGDLVLRPVLDLSQVERDARGLSDILSVNDTMAERASAVARSQSAMSVGVDGTSTTDSSGITFVQNNNSPKALDASEIYRRTKSQLAIVKERLDR